MPFQKGHKVFGGRLFEKGHVMSEEVRKKISISMRGIKRKSPTKEHREKISLSRRGQLRKEKNPNWKGGISSLEKQIRTCFQYKDWRKSIFSNNNYTCILCGARSVIGRSITLHVDHYPKSFAEIFYKNNIKNLEEAINCKEFWELKNGRTLCVNCHKKTENYAKRSNFSRIQSILEAS